MRICPLITQASILEESARELLVREADAGDLEAAPETIAEEGEAAEEDIFLNPDTDIDDAGDEPAVDEDETAAGTNDTPVRFIAKSFRGEVACLGAMCRFHDDENGACRFEAMMEAVAGGTNDNEVRAEIEEVRADIDKAYEFQKTSTGDIIGLFKEMEERWTEMREELSGDIERRLGAVGELIGTIAEDNKLIIESITDMLAEKTEELEGRIESSDDKMESFRREVSEWKGVLDKNLDALEKGLGDNERIVRDLSENHGEIVEMVENQRKTLLEEEQRRQAAEAKRLNNAGVMAYHNGQYEKALELFEAALEIDAGFTEAHNNLGLTYTEMGDEEKATEAFRKALELNPDLAATYNNLGYVFYRLGSYTEAIEMYNEAIGRSRDNSSAYTNLGNALYKLDRLDEAIDAWAKAVEIDPSNEKAKRNLKRFHAESKRD